MTAWIIAVGVGLVLVFWAVGAYNRLLGMHQECKAAFGQIGVPSKKRHELIPDLVATTTSYLTQDRASLDALTAACNLAVETSDAAASDPANPAAVRRIAGSETGLSAALERVTSLAQGHAEIEADDQVRLLREELTSIEQRIAFARQAYNASASRYNTSLRQFPAALIARLLGFRQCEAMQADATPVDRRQGRSG